jgi:integrase
MRPGVRRASLRRLSGGADAGPGAAAERPVLTVAQVFELAEVIGRHPLGSVRQLPTGGYRLRFSRNGEMHTYPQTFASRVDAQTALWSITADGRADFTHDQRYRARVLLATFASLRWGEATALRRCDLDMEGRAVQVRSAFIERSTGEMLLGPPKSRAGRRVVGIPEAIIPILREHLAAFVGAEPGSLLFPGVKGGPLRRGNFNKMSGWPQPLRSPPGQPGTKPQFCHGDERDQCGPALNERLVRLSERPRPAC